MRARQAGARNRSGLQKDQHGRCAQCTQKRASKPQRRSGCTDRSGRLSGDQTLPCWSELKIQAVADVEQEIDDLKRRGVVFEDYDMPGEKSPCGAITAGGAKAAWFKDSEGNILALVQTL